MKKNIGQIGYFLLIMAATVLLLWLLWQINQAIVYVLLAIMILMLMVTIHEFGHYLAGKILKFKINEFAVGFGPKLLSKKRKNGEIFSVRLFPLGGFCAFEGEAEEESEVGFCPDNAQQDPFLEFNTTKEGASVTCSQAVDNNSHSRDTAAKMSSLVGNAEDNDKSANNSGDIELKRFNDQPPWKRIVVFAAGGMFNLISAVVFSFIFILVVGYTQPVIDQVFPVLDKPGESYNELVEGDVLLAIDGKNVDIMNTYSELLAGTKLGDSVVVTVLREGVEQEIIIVKQEIIALDENGERTKYDGFGFRARQNYVDASVGYSLKYCVPFTAKLAWSILDAFGGLFTGRVEVTELSGPVGTIDAIAEVSALDWRYIFLLLPLIAANLGLFNLFPIPALDGSKIVFATIEWIRKKPINRNIEAYIHLAGMVSLLLFVIIIDLIKYLL